ncbi:carbohydrate ABC transporter permease [Parablautia intestinalis]|uniref:carbohydrate ABC transporter permease n=1 Tax=Parablautia intestinalis TaxID=2320100 RepID=UPI002ED3E04D
MNKKKNVWVYAFLVLCAITTLIPFIWMILTSLKTYGESMQVPLVIFPAEPQWVNYSSVWNKFPILRLYINTFLVMIISIVIQIFICSLAAYAFARLTFPGKNFWFVLSLSMMMIPYQIFLVPHYDIMVSWKLSNTLTALWLPKTFNIFALFMLRQFFSSLPIDLDEAAQLDGCSKFRIYWNILLPLLKSPIVALCILTGLGTWKDLMWPLIINVDMDKMVLSAGLANLTGQNITNYPELMAGGTLAAAPMIILFFFFQKQFVEGIAMSGSKA